MLKTARIFQVLPFLAFVGLATLAACSGSSGCGNCAVPDIHPATASPVPTPTPSPTPTPTIGPLSCVQDSESDIALGSALAPFALLAGSTITNVGNTLVTYTGTTHDDLVGVSPGTAVTGFYPPGTVTDGSNSIYAATFNTNTAIPLAAENALTIAYNATAGRPATTTFVGTPDLSQVTVTGHPTGTLPPGVYHASTSVSIGAGNLTLDGGGVSTSVFIFQIGSTLVTTLNGSTGGNVILTNGANACNIYWQVGSSATLGGTTFYGNIFAFSSITINATSFTGRALAGGPSLGTGAVSIPVITGSLITNPGGS